MASRSMGWRGFRIAVEVPEGVGRSLRRATRRLRRRGGDTGAPAAITIRTPPPLELRPRDADDGLSFARSHRDANAQVPLPAPADRDAASITRWAEGRAWYHTIELPHGVVTSGGYDHRPLVPHYGLPVDLRGKRALDVGTCDGFWAFEFERRGAHVTAVDVETTSDFDLPFPARRALDASGADAAELRGGFHGARALLGSKVEPASMSVYDLSPDTIGTFDFVHAGDLLLHLRDPLLALERIRSVTAGEVHLSDEFDPRVDRADLDAARYDGGWTNVTWSVPSLRTLVQRVVDVGFRDVRVLTTYRLGGDDGDAGPWRAVIRATNP